MCSWILGIAPGTEIGLDVLLWTSLGKFPGLPCPIPCGMVRNIVQLYSSSKAFTWVEGRILGERKRFGSLF